MDRDLVYQILNNWRHWAVFCALKDAKRIRTETPTGPEWQWRLNTPLGDAVIDTKIYAQMEQRVHDLLDQERENLFDQLARSKRTFDQEADRLSAVINEIKRTYRS